jgi:hypothetical protein
MLRLKNAAWGRAVSLAEAIQRKSELAIAGVQRCPTTLD